MTEAEGAQQQKGGMDPARAAKHWQEQLGFADTECKEWLEYGDKIQKRYRAERDAQQKRRGAAKRMAILYSNTETLKSSLYARTPKPDIRRRFDGRNPVARTVAEIIERTLSYCADNTKHDRAYRAAVQDLTLPGRGVVWMVYEADTQEVPQIDPMTQQPVVGPDGQPVMVEQIAEQEVEEEHVYWRDFRWQPANCWRDVEWVARKHLMGREDLQENKFTDAATIPLNWSPTTDDKRERDVGDSHKRAEVWEIWCKRTKSRYWIVKGHPKALRIDEDPYGLKEFFPLAEPLSSVLGTDTYVPAPYFSQYEDQADELDEVTARISNLTKNLKRRGIYDASVPELKRLARAGDNEFIGVPGDKYALVQQSGGLKQAFQVEEVKDTAEILIRLYEQRGQLIQAIYEVSGISDIMRGQSDASETATAQNIKANFGSMRMKDAQKEVQRFVRDCYRVKAELICEHFTLEKLAAVTGMDPADEKFQQAIQIMRSDEIRSYNVDIETDSTIFEDAAQDKQDRIELLTAIGQFAQNWLPVVQAQPEMLPLVGEMMAFGVRGFKAGRNLEDKIEEVMQAMQQQQGPPPDPKLEAVKAQMERDGQKHEADMAMKQMDMQGKVMDLQVKQQTAQLDVAKASAMQQMRPNGPANQTLQ